MKILQVHNRYLIGLAGEDSVVEEERRLLEERGHEVRQLFAYNEELVRKRGAAMLGVGLGAIWSRASYRRMIAALAESRPDVVHVHNTYAALSPSVLWACHRTGVPVVWTLHNFRSTCANSYLLRDGRPCTECVGRLPLPAIRHGCRYGSSRAQAFAIAATQAVHGALGTYRHAVDRFIALTDFSRSIFIEAGFPAQRVMVKPNAVRDPGEPRPTADRRRIVFAGLMSEPKGIDLLIEAWQRLPEGVGELVLVGDGPLEPALRESTRARTDVRWMGRVSRPEALSEIARAGWVVVPSRWYEGLPMVVLEAFAAGRPVLAPAHGPFPGLVPDGVGTLFPPNEPSSLADALRAALETDEAAWSRLAAGARSRYLERYTPARNHEMLIEVYVAARSEARAHRDVSRRASE